VETLWQDLRYGIRMLAKSPGFTAVAILTLALGIGANAAIFSVVNAVLLRPLPVENPDRLVRVFASNTSGTRYASISYPDYLDLRDQNSVFSGLLAYGRFSASLGGQEQGGQTAPAELIRGEIVTANYFSVLGVRPVKGRAFIPEEERSPGSAPVAVVGYGMWTNHFAADPNIIGKQIVVNGHSFTVVGVAPPDFPGAEIGTLPDIWVPIMMQEVIRPPSAGSLRQAYGTDLLHHRDAGWLHLIGRLKPGVTPALAQANCSTIAQRLEQTYSSSNRGVGVNVVPVRGGLDASDREDVLPIAGLLLAVVGLVLLIACANVANLLLARASARQKEIGVRLALGASRSRLVRQFLTESILLSLLGGGFGMLMAVWVRDLIASVKPPTPVPIALDLSIDFRVLLFALVLSVLTGIVFGLAPALQVSRAPVAYALREEALLRRLRKSRLRITLAVAQVALSLLMLITAGLLVHSLSNAQAVRLGFNPGRLLSAWIDLSLRQYPETQGRAFYGRLIERVQALPGVRSVSFARTIPLGFSARAMIVHIEGQGAPSPENAVRAGNNIVAPRYFETMEIPILRGRDFSQTDTAASPKVAIISETMARRFWPAEDAVGKRLLFSANETIEIVGVVADSKYRTLGERAGLYIYLPLEQNFEYGMALVVRSSKDPNALVPLLRQEVQSLDKALPVTAIQTMAANVSTSLWPARAGATLVGIFGLLALVLAAVGIYGVTAFTTAQRTHEIGIRMALGAEPRDILRLIIGQGMVLAAAGIAIGCAGAFAVSRVIAGFLYGINPADPVAFVAGALILGGATLLASYIPARRAMRVDPLVALRYE
jgi:predicted permease